MSYQTVRLSRGKHKNPDTGACTLELASMLLGSPFTDNPPTCSPPIAAFVRAYNDKIDDRRRQDLIAIASEILGTKRAPAFEAMRFQRLEQWAISRYSGTETATSPRAARRAARRAANAKAFLRGPGFDDFAARAVQLLGHISDETHREVIGLIKELCAEGRGYPAWTVADVTGGANGTNRPLDARPRDTAKSRPTADLVL